MLIFREMPPDLSPHPPPPLPKCCWSTPCFIKHEVLRCTWSYWISDYLIQVWSNTISFNKTWEYKPSLTQFISFVHSTLEHPLTQFYTERIQIQMRTFTTHTTDLSNAPSEASTCWTFFVPARWIAADGHLIALDLSIIRRVFQSCVGKKIRCQIDVKHRV